MEVFRFCRRNKNMPETIFTSCFGKCVQNIYQIVETSFTPQICLPSQFTGRLSTQCSSVHQPLSQRMWQLLYTEAILASKEAVLLVCFWSTFWQLEKGETSSMGLVSFLLTSAKHQTLPGSLAWVTSSQGQTWAWVSGEGREGSGPTVTLLPTSPAEPCP